MALVLALIFAVIIAYSIFLGRLYTGFALPALQEDQAFLPSRQIDQLTMSFREAASSAIRYWERARIGYNIVLAVVVISYYIG